MSGTNTIILLGRYLWIRSASGWRAVAGVLEPANAVILARELAALKGKGRLQAVFESEGLAHTRVLGAFHSREAFRESLRHRQRFPALTREDLAWGIEPALNRPEEAGNCLHAESLPGLITLRDAFETGDLDCQGAWSLWSYLRTMEARDKPDPVILLVTGDTAVVARYGDDAAGGLFKIWSGPRNDGVHRAIAALLEDVCEGRREPLTLFTGQARPLWVFSECLAGEDQAWVSALSSKGATVIGGFDALVERCSFEKLRACSDLLRSFPRTVHLDRPIRRLAIAATIACAATAIVAEAGTRREVNAVSEIDAQQRLETTAVLHLSENQRKLATLSASDLGKPVLVATALRRLSGVLPDGVDLTGVSVDGMGQFHLAGTGPAVSVGEKNLAARLGQAGWHCLRVVYGKDEKGWTADGEVREASDE